MGGCSAVFHKGNTESVGTRPVDGKIHRRINDKGDAGGSGKAQGKAGI